jgi:hypothetical protein
MSAIGKDIGHGVSDIGKHDDPKPSTDSNGKTWEDHVGTAGTVAGIGQDVHTDTKGSSESGSSGSGNETAEQKLQMAQTKSSQEEQAMQSMTSSVLQDCGQGGSALTAGTG